jgi:hypothetical protein
VDKRVRPEDDRRQPLEQTDKRIASHAVGALVNQHVTQSRWGHVLG